MSGGSLDYAYSSVNCIADCVESRARTILHRAFSKHLRKVANALHDLEWVLSSDYEAGNEVAAIRAVLNAGAEIDVAVEQARNAMSDLALVLEPWTKNNSVK